MTLDVIISSETHAALADNLKTEYTPMQGRDGMHMLDTRANEENGERWALENVTGLRTTLEDVRNSRDKWRTKAGDFGDLDIDEYKRLAAKKAEIDAWDPSNDEAAKTRLDEQNASWQSKYDTDISAANTARDDAMVKHRSMSCRSEAMSALAAAAPGSARVLIPHILPMLDVFETSDPAVDAVYVKGEGGKPRITQIAGQTGNMTAAELVASLKSDPDFADYFPGTGATGSGVAGSIKGGPKRSAVDYSKMSAAEQLKAAHRETRAATG